MTIKRGQNMANLSIHKIFMDNVQTIKNILMSHGEFHPDNEIYGKNIGTNFHTMSNYKSSSRYINGTYISINNYKNYLIIAYLSKTLYFLITSKGSDKNFCVRSCKIKDDLSCLYKVNVSNESS